MRWTLAGPGLLLLLLASGLLVPPTEAASEIAVTAADPASAPQETFDLEVSISGENFPSDSEVEFLVTGTEDPGGITVKSVKRRGPKSLVATLDVASEATVADFDIRVSSRSNGRTGKGTELFKVVQKTNGGGDQTPPGTVSDFSVDSVSFSSMNVSWTETADDGYDGASGPVWKYTFKYRTDGPLTDENWGWSDSRTAWNGGKWGSNPGDPIGLELAYFLPDTTYHVGIRAEDDAASEGLPSTGNLSPVVDFGPVTTLPFPPSLWTSVVRDTCQGFPASTSFDYDVSGRPGVAYGCDQKTYVSLWTGSDWVTESLKVAGSSSFAFDPTTNEPTFVSSGVFYRRESSGWITESIGDRKTGALYGSLAYFDGEPLVAVRVSRKSGRTETSTCEIARKTGDVWEFEVVDVDTSCMDPQLALDENGNPALAYREDIDADGTIDGVKVAVRDDVASAWSVAVLYDGSGDVGFSDFLGDDPGRPSDVSLDYDPSGKRFGLAFWQRDFDRLPDGRLLSGPHRIFVCEENEGSWSCDHVNESQYSMTVVFSYVPGAAHLVSNPLHVLTVSTRVDSETAWTHEQVDWGGEAFSTVQVGPDGIPRFFWWQRPHDDPPNVLQFAERSQ